MTALDADQIAEWRGFLDELGDIAREQALPHFRKGVMAEDKPGRRGFDPVTIADRNVEAALRAHILERWGDHEVVGEEAGVTGGDSGFSWVIDPIDGTKSFITGMPLWGVLVALGHRDHEGGKPFLGLLDQPYTGERYVGAPGEASMTDRFGARALKTRACARLADAALATTHPMYLNGAGCLAAFQEVEARARLTRFGGDCYLYAMVALGTVDVVIEAGLANYDIQALIPIVEGAGGVITDWRGRPCHQGGQVIAAGDARVHAEALEILAPAAEP